jgi:hypothetical protein
VWYRIREGRKEGRREGTYLVFGPVLLLPVHFGKVEGDAEGSVERDGVAGEGEPVGKREGGREGGRLRLVSLHFSEVKGDARGSVERDGVAGEGEPVGGREGGRVRNRKRGGDRRGEGGREGEQRTEACTRNDEWLAGKTVLCKAQRGGRGGAWCRAGGGRRYHRRPRRKYVS